jgi:hypothetical protein
MNEASLLAFVGSLRWEVVRDVGACDVGGSNTTPTTATRAIADRGHLVPENEPSEVHGTVLS